MYDAMLSGACHGMESYLVHVEVDVSDGLPCMDMIGYLASQVKESRERVRVGIKNSGYKMPPKRITINLSPADIRKDSVGFDLPVALGILFATEGEKKIREKVLVLGELGLDGAVKRVKGVLPILLRAVEEGVVCCVVPKGNETEAKMVRGITVFPVESLREAYEIMRGESRCACEEQAANGQTMQTAKYEVDFSQIFGQEQARRGAEIAAAGFHNLLLFGPPGSGKTMVAERMATILPPMVYEECMEVTKIKSVLGDLGEKETLVMKRPYEAVHHLVTPQGLIGGGAVPMPGLVTRAHLGVLFLDELPEFGRAKLDLLRQPLEEKHVRIVRKQYACDFGADFMLVAAMNPCPCGYYPNREKCNCRQTEIAAYLKRISGPLLDRIDIGVEVGAVKWEQLHSDAKAEDSATIRKRVERAYTLQMERQGKLNSNLTSDEIRRGCVMEPEAERMLRFSYEQKEKSVRGYDRVRKVARTIADLEGAERIEGKHMAEAIVLNGGMDLIAGKGGEKSDYL